MPNQLQSDIQQILTTMEIPDGVTLEQASMFVNKYITEPVTLPQPSSRAGEEIVVALDEVGAFKVATSDKLTNLKFKLGGLLEEALNLAIDLPGSTAFPPKLIKVVLDSYRRLRKLAVTDINENQANVLLNIYRLIKDHETPTVDSVQRLVELTNLEIMDALEALARLDCIGLNDDGVITLHETIIVKQEKSG